MPPAAPENQIGPTVLVFDRDKAQRLDMVDLLQAEGLHAIPCSSWSEVHLCVRQHKLEIAILDVRLELELDRAEFALLSCLAPQARIIVSTELHSFESAQAALNSGCFAYIDKCSGNGELLRHVQRAFEDSLIESLRASESRFLHFSVTPREAYWLVSADNDQMIYISPVYEDIWGFSCQSLYEDPMSFLESVHPDDRALLENTTRLSIDAWPTESMQFDYRIVRADGEVRWIRSHRKLIRNAKGKAIYKTGFAQDITESKLKDAETRALENELRQAQKMEAVGQLAAGVAHDINNVLTAILGYTDLLSFTTDPKEIQDGISGIQKATNRASTVANSLLTFSRKGQSKKVRERMSTIVGETVRWLRHMLPASIELHGDTGDADESWCDMDVSQIQQIIMNLAVNARDAMPHGGLLNISVGEAESDRGQKLVSLEIKDSGEGMDEEVLEHLFEPFFTTKERGYGTGLGLAIVRGLVVEHRGEVQVTSTRGSGSCFRITIPRRNAPLDRTTLESNEAIMPVGEGRVLLAEDQEEIRVILSGALAAAGYDVVSVEDGAAAVEAFRVNREHLDALILDIDLPKKSGLEALADIHEMRPGMPAIVISGLPRSMEGPIPQGTLFLKKPFRSIELCEELHALLQASGSKLHSRAS